jgi:hypothetical protein
LCIRACCAVASKKIKKEKSKVGKVVLFCIHALFTTFTQLLSIFLFFSKYNAWLFSLRPLGRGILAANYHAATWLSSSVDAYAKSNKQKYASKHSKCDVEQHKQFLSEAFPSWFIHFQLAPFV